MSWFEVLSGKAEEEVNVDENGEFDVINPLDPSKIQEKGREWFGKVKGLFERKSEPEEIQEESFFTKYFQLSTNQKLIGFGGCLFAGIFCLIISLLYVPTILFNSRKFAFFFCIGNLLMVLSTTFLVGIKKQIKSIIKKERIIPSILYIVSTIFVIYCAINLHNVIVMFVLIITQVVSLIWYALTYVPFGLSFIKGSFSMLKRMF